MVLLLIAMLSGSGLMAQKTIHGIRSGEMNLHYVQDAPTGCDTIFSFETFDDYPTGLTSDGSYLYSMGFSTQLIEKYTLTGQLAGTILLPPYPVQGGGDMTFDGTWLWMVSEEDAVIYKMDP